MIANVTKPSQADHAASILVMDDDPDIRDGLCDALTDEGYVVMAAENGKDAVQRLATTDTQPNLIVMDLRMPVMDGYEFLERREEDPDLSKIPVIVVSANADAQIDQPGVRLLPKPVDLEALLLLIRRQLASQPRF